MAIGMNKERCNLLSKWTIFCATCGAASVLLLPWFLPVHSILDFAVTIIVAFMASGPSCLAMHALKSLGFHNIDRFELYMIMALQWGLFFLVGRFAITRGWVCQKAPMIRLAFGCGVFCGALAYVLGFH